MELVRATGSGYELSQLVETWVRTCKRKENYSYKGMYGYIIVVYNPVLDENGTGRSIREL
jgi:hypothetical protein